MTDELMVQENGTRDIAIAGEQAKSFAEIKAKIMLSQQFPRHESQALTNALKSVERLEFAKKAYYSFPRGNATISGPSVYLARELARLWGNITHQIKIIHTDDERTTVAGVAWDLQTNTSIEAQATFKNMIYRKSGGWQTPDERDYRELVNKHGSICVRNALLQLFPRDIVDGLVSKSKDVVRKNLSTEDISIARATTIKAFETIGIVCEHLENYIECKADAWTFDEITDLRGVYSGIKSGDLSKSEVIGASKMKETTTVNVADLVKGAKVETVPEEKSVRGRQKAEETAKEPKIVITEVKGTTAEEIPLTQKIDGHYDYPSKISHDAKPATNSLVILSNIRSIRGALKMTEGNFKEILFNHTDGKIGDISENTDLSTLQSLWAVLAQILKDNK